MIYTHKKSGFALLMTLVLVFMAAAALTQMSRRSMSGAIRCLDAVEELDRRWAIRSANRVLLARAAKLLDEAEGGGAVEGQGRPGSPVDHLSMRCRLADIDYEFIFSDEQARVNVNHLLGKRGRADSLEIVRRLFDDLDIACPASVGLVLRNILISIPASKSTSKSVSVGSSGGLGLRLGAFGQVFDNVSPALLVGSDAAPGFARAITLWGDGSVNINRSCDAVIRRACDRDLGRSTVNKLLEARSEDPFAALAVLLDRTEVSDEVRATAEKLLCDRSHCYSLWTIVGSPQRQWYSLAVASGDFRSSADGSNRTELEIEKRYEFEW